MKEVDTDDKVLSHEIDKSIGMRLKVRRSILGISQDKLASSLGVTFQQVQKYEKGANRISASTLYKISKILNIPINYFFDSLDSSNFFVCENTTKEYEISSEVLSKKETYDLLKNYYKIENLAVRKKILDFVKMFVID